MMEHLTSISVTILGGQALTLDADWRMKVKHFIGGKCKDNRPGCSKSILMKLSDIVINIMKIM